VQTTSSTSFSVSRKAPVSYPPIWARSSLSTVYKSRVFISVLLYLKKMLADEQ